MGRGWGEGVVRETEIWTKKNFAAGSEENFFTALQMFDPDLKKMGMFFCQLIFCEIRKLEKISETLYLATFLVFL